MQLLAQLAKGCLLLGDRLYGCSAFTALALDHCQKSVAIFYSAPGSANKGTVIRRLRDGSRLVRTAGVRTQDSPSVAHHRGARNLGSGGAEGLAL